MATLNLERDMKFLKGKSIASHNIPRAEFFTVVDLCTTIMDPFVKPAMGRQQREILLLGR